jgi:hypothetical protein
MATKNASASGVPVGDNTAAPYSTRAPVRSPNNNIFNGCVAAVTRAPRKPIKSRHLSPPVENLN